MTTKSLVVNGVIALLFAIALFNVYSFFSERVEASRAKEAARVAAIETQKQELIAAERVAKLEQERALHELQLKKQQAELNVLNSKIEGQKRLQNYRDLKEARKRSIDYARYEKRVEDARSLGIPEGLPKKSVDGIKSATYLTIRNNPEDYTGNYQNSSLLRTAKLTKGGADGLMLFAMISDDLKAFKEMIAIGHDVNAKNKTGYTPLMFASAYNQPSVIDYLISEDADMNATDYETEGNALHAAARYNPKPEAIGALVTAGFDLEGVDVDGNTPLMIASKYNKNPQVVEKLLDLGASILAVNRDKKTAYDYARKRLINGALPSSFEPISKELNESILERIRP